MDRCFGGLYFFHFRRSLGVASSDNDDCDGRTATVILVVSYVNSVEFYACARNYPPYRDGEAGFFYARAG